MVESKEKYTEEERLNALRSFEILDTPPEKAFDDVATLAAQICKTPIAFISFVDSERQWFKSAMGFDIKETKRKYAICSDAIKTPDKLTVIENIYEDDRYYDHPFVASDLNLVFYASCPLVTHEGIPIGTICVIDKVPRKLTPKEKNALRALSRQVINALEYRKIRIKLEKNYTVVKAKNQALEDFAHDAIEDISSPINTIDLTAGMLEKAIEKNETDKIKKYIEVLKNSTTRMTDVIEQLKAVHYKLDILSQEKEHFGVNQTLQKMLNENNLSGRIEIVYPEDENYIFENKTLFKTIGKILFELSINVSFQEVSKITFQFSRLKSEFKLKFHDKNPVRFSDKKVLSARSVQELLNVIRALAKASSWHVDYHFDEVLGNNVEISIPK